jgi:hypothetical protein
MIKKLADTFCVYFYSWSSFVVMLLFFHANVSCSCNLLFFLFKFHRKGSIGIIATSYLLLSTLRLNLMHTACSSFAFYTEKTKNSPFEYMYVRANIFSEIFHQIKIRKKVYQQCSLLYKRILVRNGY